MRLPVALAKPLATAATAGPCEPSPAPSGRSFGRLISSTSTFGASGMVRIGYPAQSRLKIPLCSHPSPLQRPAPGLDAAPFYLAGGPSGINDHPGIDGRTGGRPPHHAAVAVDFDLRHYGHVASEVLILGKADAAATRAVALLAGCPA